MLGQLINYNNLCLYSSLIMKRDFAREPGVSVFLRLELLMEK